MNGNVRIKINIRAETGRQIKFRTWSPGVGFGLALTADLYPVTKRKKQSIIIISSAVETEFFDGQRIRRRNS